MSSVNFGRYWNGNKRLYSDALSRQPYRGQVQRKWNASSVPSSVPSTVPPSLSSLATSSPSDLKRLENLMESMAKSLGSLTSRLDVIEKGPPSHPTPLS